MRILAIETSCDETAVALLQDRTILSSAITSQVDLHAQWGGIVPEAAARCHVEAILPLLQTVLLPGQRADAIAVTNRPGLAGALSVGVSAAKALALAWDVPIVAVHHIEGHILSPFAQGEFEPAFPHLCLIVSGGHTELVRVENWGQYVLLAETVDDAAGEAFDKGARLLGLGYPGGKLLSDLAETGNPKRYPLPRALPKDHYRWSFSGLKTAMRLLVEREGERLDPADAAASLQAAIIDALVNKVVRALEDENCQALSLVGGVAANTNLRQRMADIAAQCNLEFYVPPLERCTDNAEMIGLAAWHRLRNGANDGLEFEAQATADLP